MALLSKEDREKRLKYLGFGEYNKENIKKFQKVAFPNQPKEWDGIWGAKTDNAARTFYNTKKVTKNFEPQEFKCECNGRYCCGYPSFMKQNELKNLQAIRDHYGKPMTITCGLRCPTQNRKVGGVSNSGHLTGKAADFNIKGVTDSVPNRNKALKWIVKLPNHKFTYGAYMVDSDGNYRSARGMGNAMHTETR